MHYQQLVPLHLAHLRQWPKYVIDALRAGAWAVGLRSNPWRSVGLDEAHEMLINRNLKMSLSRPHEPASQQLKTNTFNYRSVALKNFSRQLDLGPRNVQKDKGSKNYRTSIQRSTFKMQS
jgi:hypothetical protein